MSTELSGNDVTVSGNVSDYTLTRIQEPGYQYHYGGENNAGDFYLTLRTGSGTTYLLSETTGTVHFANGQYLALKDLPAYVAGDPTLATGTSQSDLIYQTRVSGFEAFVGDGGQDTLYLNGNARDYMLRPFVATYFTPGAPTDNNTISNIQGSELLGTNGSGRLLIDSSVEQIVFRDGSQVSFNNLAGVVTAGADRSIDHLAISYDIRAGRETFGDIYSSPYQYTYEPTQYRGDQSTTALLNGHIHDYSLSRERDGEFLLTSNSGDHGLDAIIQQSVGVVMFSNGQYLAPQDLAFYVAGSAVFTSGTSDNDILFAGFGGDQYLVGGDGNDNAFIHGNVSDYMLRHINEAASADHPAINGYELAADNGSGNIYIDQTVETLHLQNGQYLAFADIPAYVAGAAG